MMKNQPVAVNHGPHEKWMIEQARGSAKLIHTLEAAVTDADRQILLQAGVDLTRYRAIKGAMPKRLFHDGEVPFVYVGNGQIVALEDRQLYSGKKETAR